MTANVSFNVERVFEDSELIRLIVSVKGNQEVVFEGRLCINELIEWCLTCEDFIRNDYYPFELKGRSIAESIYDYYEYLDDGDDNDVDLDAMYNYRSRHCMKFGARGTYFPDIYIGKISDRYEISFFSTEGTWRYDIDVDCFFRMVKGFECTGGLRGK